jgi:hypothetical protein
MFPNPPIKIGITIKKSLKMHVLLLIHYIIDGYPLIFDYLVGPIPYELK